jgi:hypothetical protein
LEVGRSGAFQGQATQEVILRNTAADACFLAAPPTGAAVLGDGSQRAISAWSRASHRLDLAPGQGAVVLVGTPGGCAGAGSPVLASSLRLTFGSGPARSVQGVWVDVECGSPAVVYFEPEAAQPASGDPLAGLRATLSTSGPAARGGRFVYEVILSNPTARTISFGSCPSYTEQLGAGAALAGRTLLLNCAPAGSLAPGQAASFEMKLDVPATMPAGAAKLSWKLEVAGGTFAGKGIQVT